MATLTVDGSAVTPGVSYTFHNVTATHTITATFLTPYQSWLVTNGKTDTPDTLKEYAFGTTNVGPIITSDATHVSPGQSPVMQITDGMATAVFGRRVNHDGITYAVEFCDALQNWYPSTDTVHLRYDPSADPNPAVIATQGDVEAVSIPFPLFIKVGDDYVKMSQTFMRVVVTSH